MKSAPIDGLEKRILHYKSLYRQLMRAYGAFRYARSTLQRELTASPKPSDHEKATPPEVQGSTTAGMEVDRLRRALIAAEHTWIQAVNEGDPLGPMAKHRAIDIPFFSMFGRAVFSRNRSGFWEKNGSHYSYLTLMRMIHHSQLNWDTSSEAERLRITEVLSGAVLAANRNREYRKARDIAAVIPSILAEEKEFDRLWNRKYLNTIDEKIAPNPPWWNKSLERKLHIAKTPYEKPWISEFFHDELRDPYFQFNRQCISSLDRAFRPKKRKQKIKKADGSVEIVEVPAETVTTDLARPSDRDAKGWEDFTFDKAAVNQEAAFEMGEMVERLHKMVPEKTLCMFFLQADGHSYKEIAELLGLRVAQVKEAMKYGRRKLCTVPKLKDSEPL